MSLSRNSLIIHVSKSEIYNKVGKSQKRGSLLRKYTLSLLNRFDDIKNFKLLDVNDETIRRSK